jgi:hypothetical protein
MDDASTAAASNGYSGLGSIANQNWSRGWDSNSRSPAPKAGALSRTKLHRVWHT